jgi:hypothetical protein
VNADGHDGQAPDRPPDLIGRMGPGVNDVGASRGHIMDAVEASLRRLQTDHIDLYQVHGNDSVTPVEEILRALDDLVAQGKVRYIGVSNWQGWKIARALGASERKNWVRFDSLQAYYSIAGRDLEREIVPLLESEKVGLLVWGPLAGGLLSGKFARHHQKPENSRRSVLDFPLVNRERAWFTGTRFGRVRNKAKLLENAACMREFLSVRKTARRLGVHRNTAFRYRHLMLPQLSRHQPATLEGVTEADEMFFRRSYKGQKSGLPRLAHKRGSPAKKRGLSVEQVPVFTALSRGSRERLIEVLPGPDSAALIQSILAPVVRKDAVLCSDSASAYKSRGPFAGNLGSTDTSRKP